MDIEELKRLVTEFRDDRDWKKFHTPRDLAISICLEASELLEHFQWKSQPEIRSYLRNPANKKLLGYEAADILAYILSLCDVLDIDIAGTLRQKLKLNNRKYPVSKFRGKY
jgi:NTP pyrophosphatase (non-canonical NTP hydrolase)